MIAPVAFEIDPALFDPPASTFRATRPGSGFALISLARTADPAILIGVASRFGAGSRHLLFPFGGGEGAEDAFNTYRFPKGPYRLTLFTDGPTRIDLALRMPGGKSVTLRPSRRARVPVQLYRAPTSSMTGEVLGGLPPSGLPANNVLVQTVVATMEMSATGYESFWCRYRGGEPSAGYLPRCLGGSGIGVARIGPILGFEYVGFSSFRPVSGATPDAFSRSLGGTGNIKNQTSMFIWIPLPESTPVGARTSVNSSHAADNLGSVHAGSGD